MKLDIPFYKNDNDGKQCMQVAMKCVIEYFLDTKISLDELDKLTKRKEGLWTWTSQIVTVLHNRSLKVKYYSKTDLEPFLEGEPFILKHFGNDAKTVLKFTDLPVVLESIQELLKYDVFEKRILSLNEIESEIENGHVPLVLIDHNVLAEIDGEYQGHFVVLTGYDESNLYYHESGPKGAEPHKKVDKTLFEKAMNANGTDNDCVIVYGKK